MAYFARVTMCSMEHYTLVAEPQGRRPDVVLIATGSEVQLAVAAADRLSFDGCAVRVVSMPSVSTFLGQTQQWQQEVLPPGVPRVAVEAGATALWRSLVGLDGGVVGIDTFGESGAAAELAEHFGMTVDRVVNVARAVLEKWVQSIHRQVHHPFQRTAQGLRIHAVAQPRHPVQRDLGVQCLQLLCGSQTVGWLDHGVLFAMNQVYGRSMGCVLRRLGESTGPGHHAPGQWVAGLLGGLQRHDGAL